MLSHGALFNKEGRHRIQAFVRHPTDGSHHAKENSISATARVSREAGKKRKLHRLVKNLAERIKGGTLRQVTLKDPVDFLATFSTSPGITSG